MQLKKPKPIYRGAKVAVISPSYPGLGHFPVRSQRAEAALNRIGLEVVFAPNAGVISNYTAGSAKSRADDLHWAFANPDIQCVMSAIGGLNSNAILPFLDFELIAKNPKAFIGYSDVTALLLPILCLSGMVTFHGPAFLPEWGEFPAPLEYTVRGFCRALFEAQPLGPLSASNQWTDEFMDWGSGEDNRPRTMRMGGGWNFLSEGEGIGILFGGNIDTMNFLCGTPYLRIPEEDTLLILEATNLRPPAFERAIEQLIQARLFDNVRGVIFGRYHAFDKMSGDVQSETTEEMQRQLEDILYRKLGSFGVPIISRVDFGHTDPMLTIPLGVRARLSSHDHRLEILDSAVEN